MTNRVLEGDGYIRISGQYSHPRHHGRGVLEHILVYEQTHQCCVLPWAIVHHRDGNGYNNVWYNLQAMTRGQHAALHHRGKKYANEYKQRWALSLIHDFNDKKCSSCGSRQTWMVKRKVVGMRPHWNTNKTNGACLCNKCYNRFQMRKYRA